MSVKVKICGTRAIGVAQVSVDAGADFLGFNFVPSSRRFIEPKLAAEIISQIKGKAKTVGVFQNAQASFINDIASKVGLDFVQLHGNEDEEYIRQLRVPVIKAIQIDEKPAAIDADYFLLDRPNRTGKMVDFAKAAKLAARFPIFYAGGVTADNVADVVRQVRPFAVDVAAGIETDGKEDLNKIREFIKNAKEIIFET